MNIKLFFHYISYLQYPLMIVALYFAFKPHFEGIEGDKESIDMVFKSLNNMLIFMGLAISFSTLQDTTKTQNKLSRKIWESPTKGKLFLIFMSIMTAVFIIYGMIGYLGETNAKLQELSIGIIVLGIGFIGMLKTAIEMFEYHRKDKHTTIAE
ncbi:hypothetical protein [Aquimarina rhabdastrellae]